MRVRLHLCTMHDRKRHLSQLDRAQVETAFNDLQAKTGKSKRRNNW